MNTPLITTHETELGPVVEMNRLVWPEELVVERINSNPSVGCLALIVQFADIAAVYGSVDSRYGSAMNVRVQCKEVKVGPNYVARIEAEVVRVCGVNGINIPVTSLHAAVQEKVLTAANGRLREIVQARNNNAMARANKVFANAKGDESKHLAMRTDVAALEKQLADVKGALEHARDKLHEAAKGDLVEYINGKPWARLFDTVALSRLPREKDRFFTI